MRVAVLTLTRDRLDYTRHCFNALRENAGCDYDHYVLDQGSTDGTQEWLMDDESLDLTLLDGNVGISPGFNTLLDLIDPGDYDVIVRMDNDCEVVTPGTLAGVARLAVEAEALLSPRILGLNNPPQPTRHVQIAGELVWDIPQIGGIFIAAPAGIYRQFRYDERNPPWGHDDVQLCAWFRDRGGMCGYVPRFEAWHYESTRGQGERYPDYFARRVREGGPAL